MERGALAERDAQQSIAVRGPARVGSEHPLAVGAGDLGERRQVLDLYAFGRPVQGEYPAIVARKLIYSMTASLDGFVAGPHGEIDWSEPDDALHRFHNARVRGLAAQLMGRRLYETMLPWETTEDWSGDVQLEFASIWRETPKIVFSRTLERVEGNARLASEGPAETLAGLDGDIGLGGATLAASFIEQGLVDEFDLFVSPVVLGAGTRFFPPLDKRLDLELVETQTFNRGVVYLRYRRAA
jgi:dihydrofolate reductase